MKKPDSVKLHHYRFSKFLRYLKDHQAEVTITRVDDSGNQIKYTYNHTGNDTQPSLKSLVAEVLEISEYSVNEYFRTKLQLTDYHSEGESTRNMGRVIESIEMYLNSDGLVYEDKNRLKSTLGFNSIKASDANILLNNKSESKNTIDWVSVFNSEHLDDYLSDVIERFPEFISISLKMIETGFSHKFRFGLTRYLTFMQFNDLLNEDKSSLNKDYKRNLLPYLNRFKKAYDAVLKCKHKLQLIPSYTDMMTPTMEMKAIHIIENHSNHLIDRYINKAVNTDEIIQYRYELIWFFILNEPNVRKWQEELQALLLFVTAELYAVDLFFQAAKDKLLDDLRFIVYTSEKGTSKQFDSLPLKNLAERLIKYNFSKEKFTDVKSLNNNILNSSLYRYPEPNAVKPFYSVEDIERELKAHLSKYFKFRLAKDYNYFRYAPDSEF